MSDIATDRIKVNNYGEMIAAINNLESIYYVEAGSYQGTYFSINADDTRFFIYSGYFGSCCGCDWLEAEQDYRDGTVAYKDALEYCSDMKPFLILPKEHYSAAYIKSIINAKDTYDQISDEDADEAKKAIDAHLLGTGGLVEG